MTDRKKGWEAYAGRRYVGTYGSSAEALRQAKRSDIQRKAEKSRAKQAAAPAWICVRGRCILVKP